MLPEEKRHLHKILMRKWRAKNREHDRQKDTENNRKRRLLNPELVRERGRVTQARRRGAPGKFTVADVKDLFLSQEGKCTFCRIDLNKSYHIDHRVPLSRGGSNWPENLQLACKNCNLRKGSKSDSEFRA